MKNTINVVKDNKNDKYDKNEYNFINPKNQNNPEDIVIEDLNVITKENKTNLIRNKELESLKNASIEEMMSKYGFTDFDTSKVKFCI